MAGRLLTCCALFACAFGIPTSQQQRRENYFVAHNKAANEPANTHFATQPSPSPKSFGGPAANRYQTPGWVPHGQSLHPQLSQNDTNGESQLGTSNAPRLPRWLPNSPLPHGKPWGGRTAKHTNYYGDTPNTGVTRYYNFVVAQQDIAPDGVTKPGILVNGAFPGPTIEANWGDWVEVTVTNNLPNEGTALHWHGLLQHDTPWFDGVPGVQQCPIAPGSTFVYRFRADLYGTSWWHSHYSAQYSDGAYGALVIYGPYDNADYDEDAGPVLLSDLYHTGYYEQVEIVMAPGDGLPPVSNNNLINGKMNYPCANATGLQCTPNAGISKFFFESGKKYRLRLINSGAEGLQKFSIDGYKLLVIANDFVPVQPYEVDVVTLGIGQRTDVVFSATGSPTDAVWMRSTLGTSAFDGGCTLNDGVSPEAVAAIYYESADTSAVPTTNSTVPASEIENCENDSLFDTVPYFSLTPTTNPASTQQIDITYQTNGTNFLFYINNSTYRSDYNDPVFLEAKLGNTNFSAESNVYDFGDSDSIRFIIYNHATTGAHPMHMHGHNMWVLDVGTGTWDGSIVNTQNPQRRDVQLLPVAPSTSEPAYIVIQLDADNPGLWPLHCHIAWHLSGGLFWQFLEQPAAVKSFNVPSTLADTCRSWSAWTGNHIPDEIDSGL